MSVTTSTSTSSSGSTTTVETEVRDSGGPGTDAHLIDVFMHFDSSKLKLLGKPSPKPTVHNKAKLMCWWQGLELDGASKTKKKLRFKYKVTRRPGAAFKGPAEGTIVIFDQTKGKMYTHTVCIC